MTKINPHGIQFKLLVPAAVLIVVMAAIMTSIVYKNLSGQVLDSERQKLEQSVELLATLFAMKLGSDKEQVLELANSPEVSGFMRARMNNGTDPVDGLSESQWSSSLAETFQNILKSDEAYWQVSLIGIHNNGRELVRVQNDGDTVARAADQQLQSRAGDRVLLEAETLTQGEARIVSWKAGSGADRHTTTMHVISGVFTPSGRLFAVVSLDIDLAIVLSDVEQLRPGHPPIYITEPDGHIVLSSELGAAPGAARQYAQFLSEEFPTFDAALMPGPGENRFHRITDIRNVERALAMHSVSVNPGKAGATLNFIYSLPYADFLAAPVPKVRQLFAAVAAFVVIALFFAGHVSRSLIRPLDNMTESIAAYGPGKDLAELPTGRKDQIGSLARAFARLLSSLDAKQDILAREVGERRLAQGKAQASEACYRASLDLMRDAHFVSDAKGVIQSVNRAGTAMFGYAEDELVGSSIHLLLPEADRAAHHGYFERYRKTGQANIIGKGRDTGLVAARKDGSTFPVSLLIEKFSTDEGMFLTAMIRNIVHEQEIEAMNARLRAVVEHATDCIVLTSPDGVIEYVNPQFEHEYGYTKEVLLGKKPAEMNWRRSDSKVYEEAHGTVSAGGVWSGQMISEAADGTTLEHDVTISPVFDDEERVVNHIYITRNIGERNELERQLAQAQKLESIGQLAAGIAHEINTPTQYVGDNTRFIKDAFEDVGVLFTTLTELKESGNDSVPTDVIEAALEKADVEYLREEVPRALDQSIEGVERVTKIVRAMKEFSHPAQDKTPVDLNAAIQSTVTVASNEWKYVAEVQTDLDPDLPLVTCLPGQFNQVILNMIVNAAHAIADVIGTEPADKGAITIATSVVDGWAEIRISDTGAGMPEDVKRRIFDPFFTTKEVGKGTGQGLNIAHNVVVDKHGGTIEVDSAPGEGTCFTIHLPLDEFASTDDSAAA